MLNTSESGTEGRIEGNNRTGDLRLPEVCMQWPKEATKVPPALAQPYDQELITTVNGVSAPRLLPGAVGTSNKFKNDQIQGAITPTPQAASIHTNP